MPMADDDWANRKSQITHRNQIICVTFPFRRRREGRRGNPVWPRGERLPVPSQSRRRTYPTQGRERAHSAEMENINGKY